MSLVSCLIKNIIDICSSTYNHYPKFSKEMVIEILGSILGINKFKEKTSVNKIITVPATYIL